MACKVSKDQHGTSYTISAALATKQPNGHQLAGYPAVDVWWSRDFGAGSATKSLAEETLVIRQEYEDRSTADVLEVTLAQAYDLIDALNRAVENT